ncbi:tRNA pseudouridine(38-40) synthase TruA [Gracilinema caldarium]|uniref:tRNA pseudouridine synthase A n=1 Tax=Gracilinema caldarium (strain ATCC 51460 / DSM 7334 / H1) TaxID=744872 RepID=F8F0K7_GRAC1|nr:tRNA pseudouridine synthase A [Gracilinema caldarium DSM 7334]
MTERNIRLVVAYDGTDFSGWQRQGPDRSVQGDIEDALFKMHKHPVQLIGSGRTDAGVHAIGQVANFITDISHIPAERFVPALNSILKRDVRILHAEEASLDFHARFDAKSRTYRYHIISGRHAMPHELRYAWQIWRQPNISCLNAYARLLIGETDCSLFASPRDPSLSRCRYISQARFFVAGTTLLFEITANAFLWKMVRSIVGSLLYYEERGYSVEQVQKLMNSRDHTLAGPTAPPEGLFLWNIDYYRM